MKATIEPNRMLKGMTCSAIAGARKKASLAIVPVPAPTASPARRINSTKSSM
jgi:hypothetical protein